MNIGLPSLTSQKCGYFPYYSRARSATGNLNAVASVPQNRSWLIIAFFSIFLPQAWRLSGLEELAFLGPSLHLRMLP